MGRNAVLPPHLEHSHTPSDIAKRLRHGPHVSYLRDWVYGGIDGTVTTFAIMAGVVGASLSPSVVIILGIANLLADGFSMAAANYTGTRAERDEYDQLRHMEERHVALAPEGEREEIRQIFRAKGFEGEALEAAVRVITNHREQWIDTMMAEEHGMPAHDPLAAPRRALHVYGVRAVRQRAAHSLLAHARRARAALNGHDLPNLLLHRLAQKLLVADAVVAGGAGDRCHRHACRGRRLFGR